MVTIRICKSDIELLFSEALANKFKIDEFYIDILWNNMRSDLNRKLDKPLTKPAKGKAAGLKVKLFKKT